MRAVLTVGVMVLLATPAAAQWLGEPVWNSPKGGTGVTISGDYAKPNSDYGKGNTWGGRASLGIGTLTFTAGVARWKPDLATDGFTSIGGNAAFRLIGGSLLPFALNLQVGAARTDSANSTPAQTAVTGAAGFSVPLPTPGISIEPYFSPGIRYRNLGEKYGSMLMPGVGSGTDTPTAPMTWVCFWPSTALVRTAPACRLRENGSKLPPISRNAALPPHEVTLTGSMSVLSE